jgi:hypothetical protein
MDLTRAIRAWIRSTTGHGLVHFEQAVYGSFPFGNNGYSMLAHSPGCRPEWLADFRLACQRIGERPSVAGDASGVFALWLQSRVWAVVGMSPQGRDDRGRPGALGFHALFLSHREYRKAGSSPFGLVPALRADWTAETTLVKGFLGVARPVAESPRDDRAVAIAHALETGRRVMVESASPIDGLARDVWSLLTPRTRNRTTVATWAFGNDNGFDLLGVPRIPLAILDDSHDLGVGAGLVRASSGGVQSGS